MNTVWALRRRLASHLDLGSRSRRFPSQQARRIRRDVALQVALVLLLIESIFVAEQLISGLLEEVLKIRASLGQTLAMMAAMLPQVFELALPTAILIAVYRVSLGLREDREFLMLSSLGIPPHGLIRLVIRIGLVAQIAALLVGGILDPLSRYAFRLVMFSAQYHSLTGGTVTANRLFETRVGTVVVAPRSDGVPTPRLFVRQPNPDGTERVVVANGTRLIGPDLNGRVALHLYDFAVDDFPAPPPGGATTSGARVPVAPVSSLRGSSTQQSLILDDIVPFDPRGRNIAELTLPELAVGAMERTGERLELAKRIGRSLLCLLAPLIALLALSFTTRANQAFVLPIACAGLMATEIAGTSVLAGVLSAGLWPVLALVIGGGVAIGAGLILAVALRSSAVARPGLGRS
ncbi:LptF/LptG family permease [Phreatobacter sp.]|uniref:LptF/LptG family permease n=1 Tax=Phreatobacter sp. TaxID=1966341 RepID=UPI0022BC16AF|nr:LptF/LptG family permease [Phreatobacter sp.]MCZ8313840.1 LptF/LptG family permease [Phreatobacter sp.]